MFSRQNLNFSFLGVGFHRGQTVQGVEVPVVPLRVRGAGSGGRARGSAQQRGGGSARG